MKKKQQQEGAESDKSDVEDPGMLEDQAAVEESEDEAEYYRKAVGEEPDEGIYFLTVTRTFFSLVLQL